MANDHKYSSRQLALNALRDIERRGAYTDIALDRVLRSGKLNPPDRRLVTELVYGIVRRKRSLDAIINQLGKKKAEQQPPDLRLILHLGLYQLRYLQQIPPSAAVNTSVELAKENGLKKLTGVVNGVLRQYGRLAAQTSDPLKLPTDPLKRLGILHSFPDWIVQLWRSQLSLEETEELCSWFNQPPTIDLRVNVLRTSVEEVELALKENNIAVTPLPHLPQGLRITGGVGSIQKLPGFQEGWWTVQDSSAQLVSHILDPQPGETIIDACAAPGGKTTHMAELMGNQGQIWACDRAVKRLNKVTENSQRLRLNSISLSPGDSRSFTQFEQIADRVLVDAPCSGLGTLHRRPDLRWRQTPEKVQELTTLQGEILGQAAKCVKPGGILVYATCTLNSSENEGVINSFLSSHPNWKVEPLAPNWPVEPPGWLKIWPHRQQQDGFFMVKLKQGLEK